MKTGHSFLQYAVLGAGFAAFVAFNLSTAAAQQSLLEKRRWSNIQATNDEKVAACSELIRREAANRDPNELMVARFRTLRAETSVAKRDCDGGIDDYNAAIKLLRVGSVKQAEPRHFPSIVKVTMRAAPESGPAASMISKGR